MLCGLVAIYWVSLFVVMTRVLRDQCPLGYVNTLGTTCVSPIYDEVAPTNGEACKKGWMNIGAGYCKKKGPLGIL